MEMQDGFDFITKGTLKRKGEDCYGHFRIPGLICLDSGKILVYYESRRDSDILEGLERDWAPSDIAVRMSTDGGVTWSEDEILADGRGKNVNNPVMFADHSEVHFIWHEGYGRTFYRKSFYQR